MCINVACRADVAVPQPLLNLLQAHAIGIEQTGAAMAQIVKADMGHLCVTQQLPKIRGDPLPPLGSAVRLCEYKVIVKVRLS